MNEGGWGDSTWLWPKGKHQFPFLCFIFKNSQVAPPKRFFGSKVKQADKEPCLSQVVLKYMCMHSPTQK